MPLPAIHALAVNSLRFIYGTRGFLKDDLPPEASGAQKFTQEFGRRTCRRYARARGTLAGVSYSPIWSTVCDPYLDSISEGPVTGGDNAPPFTGGQCSNRRYTVGWGFSSYVQRTCPPGQDCFDQTFTSSGQYTIVIDGQLEGCSYGPIGGGSTFKDGQTWKVSVTSRCLNGSPSTTVANTPLQSSNPNVQIVSVAGAHIKILQTFLGADNCGNPPPNYTPPTFPPNLPNLPTPTNPAPGFGNNWDVNILPDGKVQFCLASDCSDGVPPNGGGGPDSGGGPGEPDGDPQETDPNDPNDPNEVSGCVEDENILTGLKIEVTQAPPNYQGLGDIYYKSCWVWMGPSSDLLDIVIDGRTLESGQFVIPDSNDCTCYKVRANPGFRISVQAYSRPKEE